MKQFYLFLSILIYPLFADAQTSGSSIRTTLGIGGGIGVRSLGTKPNVQNIGGDFLNYAGKPQPDWFGKYYALDDRGVVKEVKFGEFNADGFVRFSLLGPTGNGWLFNTNYAFSRYSYAYDNLPFQFKGYTLSRRNSDLESHAIQVGLARFWKAGYFLRIDGLYYHHFTIGGLNKPVNKNYVQNYTENGTGVLVSFADIDPNKFALVPEIGFTSSAFPAEVSLSATIPFSKYVLAEQYAYYKNRQVVGRAFATYSEFAINLTIRLGFTVFKTQQRSRKKDTTSSPIPAKTPNTRFADLPLKHPLRLLLNFDQSEATLLPESFVDLDQLASWMNANPKIEIRLEGHTDRIGDKEKNLELSRQRVAAVKDYLSKRGVASYRVETVYFGDSQPVRNGCPPPCPENRRVEMVIKKR